MKFVKRIWILKKKNGAQIFFLKTVFLSISVEMYNRLNENEVE